MLIRYDSCFKFDEGLRIPLSMDFILYYKWHIDKFTFKTLKLFTPRHGAHVSILLPSFYSEEIMDKAKKFNGQKTYILYNPTSIIKGGNTKGFNGFYMNNIKCPDADEIIKKIGVSIDKTKFRGYHITICSDKLFLNK